MEEFDKVSEARKKKYKRIRMIVTIILCAIVLGLIIAGTIWLYPIFSRIQTDEAYRDEIIAEIDNFGSWRFLAVVGAQIVQCVFAVIPASPIVILAGVLFEGNPVLAIFACVLGQTLGGMVVYGLVKAFGYRFLAIFVDPEKVKNSNLIKNKGQTKIIMGGYFMIPALPKDIVAFIAPFTKVDFLSFTLISFFARIPMTTVTVMLGTSLISGSYGLAVGLTIASTVIAVLCMIFSKKIDAFLCNFSHKIFKNKNKSLETENETKEIPEEDNNKKEDSVESPIEK